MGNREAQRGRRYAPARLREFAVSLLRAVGVPEEDGQITAHVLIEAELTGRHTHGLNRLPLYVERVERGLIRPVPELSWQGGGQPAVALLDGGNGLGPVVAWRAMEEAVARARRYGTAVVAVRHSNHCGAMSVYCHQAAQAGVVLMALTNSPPGIPPWGGRQAFLGTNPIAFGFPREPGQPPLVIDLATSVVARGNIIEAARLGQPIPEGWAIDAEGNPTTDAKQALAGAVLPMAGPKGYALALAVEVLSGVLSGAGVGPGVKNPYTEAEESNVGHFFWALDVDAIRPRAEVLAAMTAMEAAMREVPPVPGGQVALPGDRSEAFRYEYSRDGIPLDEALVASLNQLAQRLGSDLLS
ncbi:MAG: Ldh family oxidoreductase [Firmicutes bacterium]|nr:Ldh family oxidoreductase [Bacillota bacterium]